MGVTVLRVKCPECGVVANATKIEKVWNYVDGKTYRVTHLYCRHEIIEDTLPHYKFDKIKSRSKGYKPYPFQAKACEFGRESNLRALYTLEMGLGKTIVSACLVKAYHDRMAPILIVCKSSLTINWLIEMFEWTGKMCQLIDSSQDEPHFDFFSIFICSMDLLQHNKKRAKKNGGESWVDKGGFKTIIIDEVQNIKNPGARRTQLIRQLCAKADHVIGLSGTPIKNHGAEYFTILNILAPHLFPRETSFIANWVESHFDDRTGKFYYGGIKHWKRFQEVTGDFILRHTRAEVMPEIPKIQRTYFFCDLGDQLQKMYQEEMVKFKQAFDDAEMGDTNKWEANIQLRESMNQMRQLIGLAKVKPTTEYVREFLENWNNGDKRKIVIFTHHIKAADMLQDALNDMMPEFGAAPVARMPGGLAPHKVHEIEQQFKSNPDCRVLVASTLACGEGKNFQFCQDAVLMERQWNPANEEQAEARFTRIGSTADFVSIKYIVARKTFDEPMSQLVERKRSAVEQSLSGKKTIWRESDFMMELMNAMRATK